MEFSHKFHDNIAINIIFWLLVKIFSHSVANCSSYEKNFLDLIDSSLKLGRSEECDIVIYKSRFLEEHLLHISKEHFQITKDPEDVYITYITDLSKNGTYVNGRVIGRNNTVVLQNNDVIAIGNMLRGRLKG